MNHKPVKKICSIYPCKSYLEYCTYVFFSTSTGAGVILCIEKALVSSGVSREDVNYINAHATSTPAGDLKEYQALIHCFGKNPEVNFRSYVLITIYYILSNHFKGNYNLMPFYFFQFMLQLRVNSTKSMIGHLLGASGGVEAVATVQVKTNVPLYL
jgi:3-oxoacyl-[acyl-carrier-protein] synthase II